MIYQHRYLKRNSQNYLCICSCYANDWNIWDVHERVLQLSKINILLITDYVVLFSHSICLTFADHKHVIGPGGITQNQTFELRYMIHRRTFSICKCLSSSQWKIILIREVRQRMWHSIWTDLSMTSIKSEKWKNYVFGF